MYLLKDKKELTTFQSVSFYVWVYIVFIFMGYSIRIINILMIILTKTSTSKSFISNQNNPNVDKLTENEKEELRKEGTKNNLK